MTAANYYALFGVAPTASEEEIRAAFRRAVLEHHPDTNGGRASAREYTILLKEAYDVLSDASKRTEHDTRLQASGTRPPSFQTRRGDYDAPRLPLFTFAISCVL